MEAEATSIRNGNPVDFYELPVYLVGRGSKAAS
jgi:hypothetical protein